MPEQGGYDPNEEARDEKQWEADRAVEAAPLPYADRDRYQNDEERQVDLVAAERGNIARAAGELGLTTDEWTALRSKLGRSPRQGDV